MFDSLSGKLQNAFRNLRGLGKISESNIADSLREVRLALLDADVHFKVVKEFLDRVQSKSLGAEVIQSVQPGQQIVKIIYDELIVLLGSENAALNLTRKPSSILMAGLHGSGKTPPAPSSPAIWRSRGAPRSSSPPTSIVPPRWINSPPSPRNCSSPSS